MRQIRSLPLYLIAAALVGWTLHQPVANGQAPSPTPQIEIEKGLSSLPGVRLRNLEIFALVGPDQNTKRDYLTLSEAMEKKLVRVQETGNVSELKIENQSKDRFVFIQSGEIVKGGRQDRCLKSDLLLSPKSGPQPIGSFCVEQSRWSGRGQESSAAFSKSDKQIVTSNQRYAVKAAKEQGAVWNEVAKSKVALTEKASKLAGRKVDVEANASPSSLQLALESPDLTAAIKEIRDGIAKSLPERADLIGVAYAINGKLVNAEIYGSARLFAKLRDKVIEAASAEAIAELKDDQKKSPAIANGALRDFLVTQVVAAAKPAKPNAQTEWREHEAASRALYESRDTDFKAVWCHRNVILADESVKSIAPKASSGQNRTAPNANPQQAPAPNQSGPRRR